MAITVTAVCRCGAVFPTVTYPHRKGSNLGAQSLHYQCPPCERTAQLVTATLARFFPEGSWWAQFLARVAR